jgi:cullin-associated NEDD8-dissociated protein 1
MHDIIRITLSFIENTPAHKNNDDQQHDDELIEYCLQAIETYLKRCPKETNEFVPKIVDICIVYLKYDPNFNYEGHLLFDPLMHLPFFSLSLSLCLEDDNEMNDDQNGGQSDDDGDDDDKGTD